MKANLIYHYPTFFYENISISKCSSNFNNQWERKERRSILFTWNYCVKNRQGHALFQEDIFFRDVLKTQFQRLQQLVAPATEVVCAFIITVGGLSAFPPLTAYQLQPILYYSDDDFSLTLYFSSWLFQIENHQDGKLY